MAKASAARVFFDVVGTLQANSLVQDARDVATVQRAIFLDAVTNITDNFDIAAQTIRELATMATDAFYEYEMQLVRVRKFYNGMEDEVERFAERSVELGEAFAFSGDQALAASARTAQLKGVLESQLAIIEATRAGLLMSAVGEMETEMGMNRFIALAQQTGFLYGNLTKAQYDLLGAEQQANLVRGNSIRVLDELNTIENSSVATMEDITFVLNQFASQADIAGESIGDMAAMSALLLETGEEVSRAGTGLRMIYQRIGNENSDAVKALQELMGGVDASVVTQMKLSDIIKEIAPAYAQMTAEEKRALAVNIAGSRHYVKFLKLMENSTRLTELQTAALETHYLALDEFGEKAKAAAFQQQQLDAAIKNTTASIGENLTDAFMQSDRALLGLLRTVDSAISGESNLSKFAQQIVQGAVGMAGIYQVLVRPITETGAAAFNTYIAFKTLSAVQRAMKPEAQMLHKSRLEAIQDTRFLETATRKLTLSQQELTATHPRLGSEVIKGTRTSKILTQGMREAIVEADALRAKLNELNTSYVTGQTTLLNFTNTNLTLFEQMRQTRIALKDAELSVEQLGNAYIRNQAKLAPFKYLLHSQNQSLQGANALNAQGIKGLFDRAKAQQALNETLGQYNAMVQSTITMTIPLTAAEKKLTMEKIESLDKLRNENIELQGNIAHKKHLAMLNGQDLPAALQELDANLTKSNATLNERIKVLQMGLLASEQTEAALKSEAAAAAQAGNVAQASAARTFAANTRKAMSFQKVNTAMMPMTFLVPMLFDGEKQMAAMTGVLAVTLTAQLVPALFAVEKQAEKTGAKVAFASGGLSILLAGIIAVGAAFAATKLDIFTDPLDDLTALNSGLEDLETNIASIMSKQGAVMPGVIDATYGELAQDTGLLTSATSDLEAHLSGLESTKSSVGNNDALKNSLEKEIAATQQAIRNIEDLNAAIIMNERIKSGAAQAEAGFETGFFMRTRKMAEDIDGEIIALEDNEKTSFLNRLDFRKDFYIEYTNLEGEAIREEFKTKKKRDERLLELEQAFSQESINNTGEYIDALLAKNDEGNNALLDSQVALQGELLGQMNKFSNAREELFFGSQANFTGALFKQVSQGGVENLLYKTEIIQTNVFNGMTLPEMVAQVSEGVVKELQDRGAIV